MFNIKPAILIALNIPQVKLNTNKHKASWYSWQNDRLEIWIWRSCVRAPHKAEESTTTMKIDQSMLQVRCVLRDRRYVFFFQIWKTAPSSDL
jgi:hypothetical protein